MLTHLTTHRGYTEWVQLVFDSNNQSRKGYAENALFASLTPLGGEKEKWKGMGGGTNKPRKG